MSGSVGVRQEILCKLRRDLVGPSPGPEDADLAREAFDGTVPSRWYLTGFLAPQEELQVSDTAAGNAAATDDERDTDADDHADLFDAGTSEGGAARPEDDPPADGPTAPRRYQPSSIGLTVLVPAGTDEIEAVVTWGDYRTEPPLTADMLVPAEEREEQGGKRPTRPDVRWVRVPRGPAKVRLPLVQGRSKEVLVPDSAPPSGGGGALMLVTHMREYDIEQPEGGKERVRAVTVFLINRRARVYRRYQDLSYAFQVRLELLAPQGFRPRCDLSGWQSTDDDVRLADLHYRDVAEYGVGRGTSAGWEKDGDGTVRRVWTEPMPSAFVERVVPNEGMEDVERRMEDLAELAAQEGDALAGKLMPLASRYRRWIEGERQRAAGLAAPSRRQTAGQLVAAAAKAADRIEAGIEILRSDAQARTAFRLMNAAVAAAARHRNAGTGGDPAALGKPTWRPFQLAFILLNLRGLVDPAHDDREIADLLFFPTGGGKTEAYLGLAAFTIALRRLRGSGVLGSGVSVIMRYTLRLLTLDQLSRAAGVICALEREREAAHNIVNGRKLLGDWPIEIGLWVGSDASPNKLGGTGNTGDDTAVTRVRKYRSGRDNRAPAPIKACPWCNTGFTPDSFQCVPTMQRPVNLELRCVNTACDFAGKPLPILTVDEAIYHRLPAFLIATVDKFASLPWVGEAGAFFGHVDRHDPARGFLGAAQPPGGEKLWNGLTLDPPDLVVQDELHLISGPLGTVAGLYETAIDRLCARTRDGKRIRPKIVASTATVRRAREQLRALFDRDETQVFPPPGVDRTDSFFAETLADLDQARLYVGIAAQGRGPKLIFRQTLTTMLAAAETAAQTDGGAADPYMTAVCYFNALRELGGARRIVEDEVRRYVASYGSVRRRHTPNDKPFADRELGQPLELTSRVSTDDVAEAKRRLELAHGGKDAVDVALATNMISVGLDIGRLGLMLVQGQPKTTAEYIQATSRVGREAHKPGLVLALLNLHKPRDRAHFEQFTFYHSAFYRSVEATSVTPWARRALDRALAAVVVAIARHVDPDMTPDNAAERIAQRQDIRDRVRTAIVERAPPSERAAVEQAVDTLFADWITTAARQTSLGNVFTYAGEKLPNRLLIAPLDPARDGLEPEHRPFVASRSMRDVEPNVNLKVLGPDGQKIANAQDIP